MVKKLITVILLSCIVFSGFSETVFNAGIGLAGTLFVETTEVEATNGCTSPPLSENTDGQTHTKKTQYVQEILKNAGFSGHLGLGYSIGKEKNITPGLEYAWAILPIGEKQPQGCAIGFPTNVGQVRVFTEFQINENLYITPFMGLGSWTFGYFEYMVFGVRAEFFSFYLDFATGQNYPSGRGVYSLNPYYNLSIGYNFKVKASPWKDW